MEIYSSAQSKTKAEKPRQIFYSRTRLILGVIIWILASAFFGTLTSRAGSATGAMAAGAVFTLLALWMLYNCIRGLTRLDKPVLVISREGIQFDDGVLIHWEDMTANTYLDQSYVGIPVYRAIEIKTTLAKPKRKHVRVSALEVGSDEYLEICDHYSRYAR
ncbi:hypothetical protein LZ198_26420 [Myxococcus sp. K15C18031901]|uniref:hypothetical protein n=1 Tax=Myxococcus dinghuensis TaxID=2906761 RepID=UPI0020A7AB2D|nr:hypothetical protein [Myxococcus dinghuensis]MCP3102412.1 hypothetical protein [Myxococcus dinghuensis]